jgi:acetyl-CoA C-acetyltransferase
MSERHEVVLIGSARTPFGRFGGSLRDWSLPLLAGIAVQGALQDAAVEVEAIGEFALGVNLPGSDRSVARQASLRAGLPVECTSYTVDRACCSSLAALAMLARGVESGVTSVGVAGGVENMSKVPFFLEDLRWGHRLGEVRLSDQLVISCPYTGVPRAVQAADESLAFRIGREEQDAWALRSQQFWSEASARGDFQSELVVVRDEERGLKLEVDECPRPDTTLEALSRLPLVNGSRTVTAGNAPAMATGATALVVATAEEARRREKVPLARFLSIEAASGPPANIASAPAVAARKALDAAGLGLEQIDLIEINEAFAAVPLVTTEVLADGDAQARDRLRSITNVNGGAIAVGHPTGATAARLVMTLTRELRRRGGGLGLVTICGGIGEAQATVIEVPGA